MFFHFYQCIFATTTFEAPVVYDIADECLTIPMDLRLLDDLRKELMSQVPEELLPYVTQKTLPQYDEREEGIRVTRRQDRITNSNVLKSYERSKVMVTVNRTHPVFILGSPRTNARVFLGYPIGCDEIFQIRAKLARLEGVTLINKDPALMGNGSPIFLHITVAMISPAQGITLNLPKGQTVLPLVNFKEEMMKKVRPEVSILSSNPVINEQYVREDKDIHRAALEGYVDTFRLFFDVSQLSFTDEFGFTLEERIQQAVSEKIKGAEEIAKIAFAHLALEAQ